jgi:hypothetical protein
MKPLYVQAIVSPGAWKLPDNPLWNIPDAGEDRFDITTTGSGWNIITKIRGLAIAALDRDPLTSEPSKGYVFGYRTMNRPKESGYQLEGRISIGGKKYRAFTSSILFERSDKTLCDVAVLYVCNWKPGES